jgi:hypothetical protein
MLEPTRLPAFRSFVRSFVRSCNASVCVPLSPQGVVTLLPRRMRQERSNDVCAALDAQGGAVLYHPREWLELLANALIEALEVRLAWLWRTVRPLQR